MALSIRLLESRSPSTRADLAVVLLHQGKLSDWTSIRALDRAARGGLGKLLAREDFKGKKDQEAHVPTLGRLGNTPKIVFLGLGPADAVSTADWRTMGARAARAALSSKAASLSLSVPVQLDAASLRAVGEGLALGAYRFTKYFTGDRRPKATLARVDVLLPAGTRIGRAERAAVSLGAAVGGAVCITRDLVNEPPNELFPADLAAAAERVAKQHGLKCKIFDRREIERRGMKLVIAVGRGSSHDPRVVHVTYTPPGKPKKKVAIVGKGLTFDSGGLCIKPAAGMGEMKSDMSGAANVIGLMAACALVKPEVEVHGLIGAAENMPDGDAYRPGDVFGSLDGKTVEIINTDAEGRLVLADVLAYARSLEPDLIVDNATLTGACIVALGKTCSGFYATADDIGDQFAKAASRAGEQFWRLPLLEDLKDQLKSDVADLKHTGDRWGGSITAALFLREFVGKVPWIHMDIAGPVLGDRATGFYPKGATGHGVLTLLDLVERMG